MEGKTFPAFPAHAQPAILRIWQETHCLLSLPIRFVNVGELLFPRRYSYIHHDMPHCLLCIARILNHPDRERHVLLCGSRSACCTHGYMSFFASKLVLAFIIRDRILWSWSKVRQWHLYGYQPLWNNIHIFPHFFLHLYTRQVSWINVQRLGACSQQIGPNFIKDMPLTSNPKLGCAFLENRKRKLRSCVSTFLTILINMWHGNAFA